MSARILIAGLFHETHTFVEGTTPWSAFDVLRGDAILARTGDSSPLGGALERGVRLDWSWIPTIDCRATPSAVVEDEVLERYWSELKAAAERAAQIGVDAVFLVLHGAMVTRSCDDAEGELLERLRGLPGFGDLPIVGVFDLHAHFSDRMARYADALVAYRENPHVDARDAAIRAVDLLAKTLREGKRPHQRLRRANAIWPPTGTGTADEPMRSLEAMARELETEHPEIAAANVVAGFAFGDSADVGVRFSIVTFGDDAEADAALERFAVHAWEHRREGNVIEPPVDEVLRGLLPALPGLTVLAEPADNIGGGAPGDGTGLLRAFVRHRVEDAAVCLCDPQAVARLREVPLGAPLRLALGGRGSRFDEGPLALDVNLISRSDGKFELNDKRSHLASLCGDRFDMGPCAVVRHAGILILLTSHPTPPMDLGQWTSQGIDLTRLAFVGVKAAVAHRRAYAPIAARMASVGVPGPCTSDLRSLPYRRAARPLYPLDD